MYLFILKYNDKKRLIEMIRKLNGMDQDCLPGLPRSDCKAQIAGKSLQEAINFPPPTVRNFVSFRFSYVFKLTKIEEKER